MKRAVGTVLLLLVIVPLAYSFRLAIPYPTNYVTRLTWLSGWYAPGQYTVNCSGFLANAHGEKYLNPDDFFRGVGGKMEMLAEYSDRSQIDEAQLQPGDVAAWGTHVAAFLKPGVWIDSDQRRGSITTYRLQDKPASDPWFRGTVRIMRWKKVGHGTFRSAADTLGRFAGETEVSAVHP